MKEITKQRTVDYTVYQAEDGTEFSNKRECEIYDNSALGILFAKLRNITLNKESQYDLFTFGSDDCETHIIVPKTMEDLETIQRIFHIATHANLELGKEYLNTIILMHLYWDNNNIDNCWLTFFNKCVEAMTNNEFTIVKKTETVKKKK